jgi:hypothetical protein
MISKVTDPRVFISVPKTGKGYADRQIQAYVDSVRTEFLEIAHGGPDGSDEYILQITTDTFRLDNRYASYKLNIYEYTGGAHGNSYYQTFSFDLQQKREIGPYDAYRDFVQSEQAFYRIVSDVVMTKLAEQLEDTGWIAQGTGTNPENYRNFVLTEDGITFFFPPYQVAAYSDGSFEVTVDWPAFQ